MNTGEQGTPWTPLGWTGQDRSPLLERIDTSLCRVLVIEDSESDVALIRAELEDAFDGVDVVATPLLKEGLRRARDERFDILLLDLNLPDSRGAETFDTARNAIPNLPIIVLTGLQDAEAERELLGKGAQDYLSKGIDVAPLLVRSMVNAIQRHRLTAERDAWTQQLRESEARTRTIIEANADAIIIVSIDGVIRFVNPTAIQMFGRPGNVLLGQHFGFPIAQGQVTELDVRRADGTTGIAEMRVVEMKWGDEPAFLASLRDITEHKRAQEEIRRLNTDLEKRVAERTAELFEAKEKAESSDRFKSAFLASMSHELRTPLNGIIGFSEFLIDTKAGGLNAKQQEYLNDILNSGRHLLQLINNVLDLSKIEAGKMVFSPEPFRASHALQEVCSVIFPMARRRSIQVRYHVDEAADEVNLDLPKFKQVLYNLISNGVKFNRDRGEVNITVSVIGETTLCLKVRDTGVGIAADDLDKLFKEFQQLDSTRARRHEGSGLGLALTRRIVRLQQGEIMVESTPGVGSSFWVELPRNLERRTE